MRLRLGVLLWLMSWIPYGIILGLSGALLTLSWGFEIALGIIGIALAGTSFAAEINAVGWRRAPGEAVRTLFKGTRHPSSTTEQPE